MGRPLFFGQPGPARLRAGGLRVALWLHSFATAMLKPLLTVTLLLGLLDTAHAQHSIRQRSKVAFGAPSLGVKAGVSLADLAGLGATQYSSLIGFHAGGYANLSLTRHLSFQPELLYSQKGARYPASFEATVTRRLSYLDLPLAFHYNFQGFYLEAGPQLGYLIGARDSDGSTSVAIDRRTITELDLGYVLGLGVQPKQGVGAGFRYCGEFTNVNQPTIMGTPYAQNRARNSVFQLFLSYSFRNWQK